MWKPSCVCIDHSIVQKGNVVTHEARCVAGTGLWTNGANRTGQNLEAGGGIFSGNNNLPIRGSARHAISGGEVTGEKSGQLESLIEDYYTHLIAAKVDIPFYTTDRFARNDMHCLSRNHLDIGCGC